MIGGNAFNSRAPDHTSLLGKSCLCFGFVDIDKDNMSSGLFFGTLTELH